MSAGNPGQKVYVYAVFSSLRFERRRKFRERAEYCFESTVSEEGTQ